MAKVRFNKYTWISIVVLVLFILVEMFKPTPVNWEETFSAKDDIPFGTKLVVDALGPIFPDRDIEVSYIPIYDKIAFNLTEDTTGLNYIVIGRSFQADEWDIEQMMDFVERGNNIFISTEYLSDELEDSLGIELEYRTSYSEFMSYFKDEEDTLAEDDVVINDSLSVSLQLYGEVYENSKPYEYKKDLSYAYIIDSIGDAKKLGGYVDTSLTNLVQLPVGKGSFFIHSYPLAFTNYYLLYEDHHEYISSVFRKLPVGPVIWHEFDKSGRQEASTPFRYLLSQRPLKWALYITVISLLIYMLFKAKREQRAVPVVQPPKNSTREFAELVGELYYEKRNNKDIADKKIAFFRHTTRQKLHVDVFDDPSQVIKELVYKTNSDLKKAKELVHFIHEVGKSTMVGNFELLKLDRLITEFKATIDN